MLSVWNSKGVSLPFLNWHIPLRVVIHTVPDPETRTLETRSLGRPSAAVNKVLLVPLKRVRPPAVPTQRSPCAFPPIHVTAPPLKPRLELILLMVPSRRHHNPSSRVPIHRQPPASWYKAVTSFVARGPWSGR